MRKLVGVVLAAGLLASLTACSSTPLDGCEPLYPAGSNSNLVTAKGKIGSDPQASFPTPLVVGSTTQASTVIDGDGAGVLVGSAAVVQVTIYDGSTGDTLISTDYSGSGLLVSAIDAQPQFGGIVECATVGSRVAAVGSAGDLIGEAAITQNQIPITVDDVVVVVADVEAGYLGKANGADQVPQAGYPAVVLAPDGRPGLTFPSGEPTDGSIALKQGSGETVKKNDLVVANVTGVVWGASSTFISSWDSNAPRIIQAAELGADTPGGVIPALAKALVGQKVGSQLLVVASGDNSYAAGSEPTGVAAGDTVVFVVDILGISE